MCVSFGVFVCVCERVLVCLCVYVCVSACVNVCKCERERERVDRMKSE